MDGPQVLPKGKGVDRKCVGATGSVSNQWAKCFFWGLGAAQLSLSSGNKGSLAVGLVVEVLDSVTVCVLQLKTSQPFSEY